jgi:hypothetical protein
MENLLGYTAVDEAGQPGSAMGTHDNQVDPMIVGVVDNSARRIAYIDFSFNGQTMMMQGLGQRVQSMFSALNQLALLFVLFAQLQIKPGALVFRSIRREMGQFNRPSHF